MECWSVGKRIIPLLLHSITPFGSAILQKHDKQKANVELTCISTSEDAYEN